MYRLIALGLLPSGEQVVSVPVDVDIERPDEPIRLSSPALTLSVGDQRQLEVFGNYRDGSRNVDLTYSTRLTFASASREIAEIDKGGTVRAIASGSTRIIVNGGKLVIPVSVRRSQK
jgi:hypothetical protein